MPNNYLLVVEGANDEKNILQSVFEKYGFNVIKCEEKISAESYGEFYKYELKSDNDNVVIIEGPRNRIHDFLISFDTEYETLEKLFHYPTYHFSGIFLIYDVDHNDSEDVEIMFNKFNNESDGLLLLNSPCLEVLADTNVDIKRELKFNHLKEYKKTLNKYHNLSGNENSVRYIINHFNEIMIHFLEMNKKEFNENNIMEHPRLIKNKINLDNERINYESKEDSYVIFRYFTTVLYVAIAYANKLTNEIDNYGIVHSFFENKMKENQ